MKALVLAAGLGTRLRPLTQVRAKPALPVLGVPGLWFGAWHLKRELDPEAFAINVSHLPQSIRDATEDPELKGFTGISFELSDESSGILGSSGALWKLASWIGKETLAVTNGDSISFPSWKRMAEVHHKTGALITLHVRGHSDSAEQYTGICLGKGGRVDAFGTKTKSGLMFSGSYLIEPELLARLPKGASELRPTLLEPLIKEQKLFAFREDVEWFDTGTSATYAEANFDLHLSLPLAMPLIESKMRKTKSGAWVPVAWSSADVSALKLSDSVVLTGSCEGWAAHSNEYGPRFIGIESPAVGPVIPTANAIVLSNQLVRL